MTEIIKSSSHQLINQLVFCFFYQLQMSVSVPFSGSGPTFLVTSVAPWRSSLAEDMLNRLLASSKGRERTFLLTTLNVNSLIKCLTAATITQRQSLPFLLDTLDRGLIAYVRLTGMTRRGGQQLKPRQEMLLSWSDWDGKRFAGREGEGEGGEEYSRSSSVSGFITVSVSQSLHYSFVLEPPSPPLLTPLLQMLQCLAVSWCLILPSRVTLFTGRRKKSFWQTLGGRFLQVWTCGKTLDVT